MRLADAQRYGAEEVAACKKEINAVHGGLGFRAQGLGSRVQGLGLRV